MSIKSEVLAENIGFIKGVVFTFIALVLIGIALALGLPKASAKTFTECIQDCQMMGNSQSKCISLCSYRVE